MPPKKYVRLQQFLDANNNIDLNNLPDNFPEIFETLSVDER